MKEPSIPWQNVKSYFVAYQQQKRKASTSNPNPFGDTFLNSKRGAEQLGTGSYGNATGAQGGLLPLWPPAGEKRGEFKIQPGSEPPSQLTGWGRGGGEGGLSCRRHLQRSRSLRHQRPGPRCHVPAFVPAIPHPTRGRGHILGRPPGSLPSRRPSGPHLGPGRERAVRAVGTVAAGLVAPEPGPGPAGPRTQPPGWQAPRGQASAPPARPGALGSGPAPQAHLQCVKSACSPPLDRRLLSAGLARPAQPLSSAPLRSLELHSAHLRARLLPNTSEPAWVSEAIL